MFQAYFGKCRDNRIGITKTQVRPYETTDAFTETDPHS